MPSLPKSVHIMEVGMRDGLQIEPRIVATDDKLRLIELLAASGVKEIEVGSYVNPRAVPQMADTAELIPRLKPHDGLIYRALWLNLRGLETAIQIGGIDLGGMLFLTASEIFCKRNTNRGIEQTYEELPGWMARYRAAGVASTSAAIMAAFGCNFEGPVPAQRIYDMIERLMRVMEENGCRLELLQLADTMGWANPQQIRRVCGTVRDRWPELTLKLHLHDTRGCGIANAVAGMEEGVVEFDASVGGLGGCPFAGNKGAAGNVCTEDLVFACEEMGVSTGIDLERMIEAARLAQELVGHPLPGKLMQSGSLAPYRQHAS